MANILKFPFAYGKIIIISISGYHGTTALHDGAVGLSHRGSRQRFISDLCQIYFQIIIFAVGLQNQSVMTKYPIGLQDFQGLREDNRQ